MAKNNFFLFCAALLLPCVAFALTTPERLPVLNDIQLSAAVGFNQMTADNTHLVVSPFETDSIRANSFTKAPIWKVGVGKNILEEKLKTRNFLNRLLLELNLYRGTSTIKGEVLQYQFTQFNNYIFRLPVVSTRLMLDAKPDLFTYRNISPYLILGLGAAWNEVSYYENAVGAGVSQSTANVLNQKTNLNFAYDLGLGVRANITEQMSASLEYLYTNLGSVSPGSSAVNVAVASVPTFKLRSQSILLGLNWKI